MSKKHVPANLILVFVMKSLSKQEYLLKNSSVPQPQTSVPGITLPGRANLAV
jgi:hypothetical protein